jgi:hypothetical protein
MSRKKRSGGGFKDLGARLGNILKKKTDVEAPSPTPEAPATVPTAAVAPTPEAAVPIVNAPAAEPTATGASQPAVSESKPQSVGIMDSFSYLYTVFGYFGALLVVMVFLLITLDVFKYSIASTSQYVSLFLNPNKYNKDTLDVATLAYYKNNLEEEPYTIYLQQQLVGLMFNLGNYFIIMIIFQLVLFLGLTIIYKLSGRTYVENLNIGNNTKIFIIIGITIACAFIMNLYYNSSFLKGLQPSLKYANDNLENIKNYMYDNITTNEPFLKAMIMGDVNECVKIMNGQSNVNSIARMIFTLSLYNFYKINISESEEVFSTVIQSIFTPTEIAVRNINPIHYMYYNQNVFLPNLYPILRRYLYGDTKAIQTPEKDRQLREEVTTRINELNKRLMYLFKLPKKRDSVRNYLYVNWLIISVFIVGIYAVYKKEFNVILNDVIVPYIKLVSLMFMAGKKTDEEAEAKKKADEEAEAKKKADEEAEAKKKADEEAEAKKKADEEAEAKKKADEEAEAKKKADEEAEAKKKAEKKKADEEAEKKKAEEAAEAKKKAEEAEKKKADEEAAAPAKS